MASKDNNDRLHDENGLFMPGETSVAIIGDHEQVEPSAPEGEGYDEEPTEEQKVAYRRIVGFFPGEQAEPGNAD